MVICYKKLLPAIAITAAPAAATPVSAPAAATAPAITPAAAARWPFLARTRFIHRQCASLKFFSVKLGNGRVRFGLGSHFNEGKTPRTSRSAVLHDVYSYDCARRGKIILKIIFGRTEGKVPDKEFGRHYLMLSFLSAPLCICERSRR